MDFLSLTPADLLDSLDSTPLELVELTLPMPHWLKNASNGVRQEYLHYLTQYQQAATFLEQRLDAQLPSFEAFISQQLQSRISVDLGVWIEPDQVMVDLPHSVSRHYNTDPQTGQLTSGAAWVASIERERCTLTDLARRNLDNDDAESVIRLQFGRVDHAPDPAAITGLSVDYLHRVIPELDVTQGYRALLRRVFHVPSPETALAQEEAELLLMPFELEAVLIGFAEHQRRRLSDDGYRLLKRAARCRTPDELLAANIQTFWLLFKGGSSVSGESDSHTLSGLCVMQERTSKKTVIYLPGAAQGVSLIEASGLDDAKAKLMQQLIVSDGMVEWLASRTMQPERFTQHTSYIRQALARAFEGFLSFVPALNLQLAAEQLASREWLIHDQTLADSRSNQDIRRHQRMEQNQRTLSYFRAVLAFVPGIGTLISAQDAWRDGHEAAQAFEAGNVGEGVMLSGNVALSMLDVVLSLIPGTATVGLLVKARHTGRMVGMGAKVVNKRYVMTAFKGYEREISLSDALRQTGKNTGTWLKDGQFWIERQGQAYQVYRRQGEQTLRLKKTALQGYEPPVRFDRGEWIYHSDVGLKGGVSSKIAETLIAEAHTDPGFTRREARELLDRFEFPPDNQRRLELDLAIHYQRHRATPDWAQRYRRPVVATLPPALPGTSGTKRPKLSTEAELVTPAAIRMPDLIPHRGPEAWKNWGRRLPSLTLVDRLSTQPPVFRATDSGLECIQIDDLFYNILPAGSSRHARIVFLHNPASLGNGFAELNETIRLSRYSQPVMASHLDGKWTVHGPLFTKEIYQLVGEARPGLTITTQHVLAQKLFEMADGINPSVTSTRLLNMKSALIAWRKSEPAVLPEFNDPLLMLRGMYPEGHGTKLMNLNISYGPSVDAFHRLDFDTQSSALFDALVDSESAASAASLGGRESLKALMSKCLVASGYEVLPADEPGLKSVAVLFFKRPGDDHLFVLNYRRLSNSSHHFNTETRVRPFPVSDAWLDYLLRDKHEGGMSAALIAARQEGRLVRLIGGTNKLKTSDADIQVFVVRIADDV